MEYDNLYLEFKKEVPECLGFFDKKETDNLVDDTVGVHISFGMVVVPYICNIINDKKTEEIKKVFDFIEKMAVSKDIKVQEVLDFTVLEGLADEGYDVLERCKKYMKINTVQHCEEVEKYFY
ncbi:DUF7674 family protein [Anaeromicropila herbilytica]|uniref:DUF7674 domain-containing protein n=1 Tax=Anaeromicropila herbilytica TaxID=2785025 RepID=A0A7R7EI18_9FIRM|nr:hypothetical protein [Anaeromicropila herbilytica]BCN29084.1 hypothetical protein bsdtb5_03790 [Anaeromicropila herbilytica]